MTWTCSQACVYTVLVLLNPLLDSDLHTTCYFLLWTLSIVTHLISDNLRMCMMLDLINDDRTCYETASVLSHLILSIVPLPSYQMNYLTLIWFQFGCYGTALYLIFYILSLFGLVDIIMRFDSCLVLLHTADSMPSYYFILLTLKSYSYSAKLYSYSAISVMIFFLTHIYTVIHSLLVTDAIHISCDLCYFKRTLM